MSFSNRNMKDLCDMFDLYQLYTNKKTTFSNLSTFKTGISDHHSFIRAVFHPTFFKGLAKFLYDRSYNNYNKEQFKNVLKRRLVSASNFEVFFDTFLATLNEHTPLKKKKKLYSHQVFMSKTRRMAIMKRSKLREVHLTRKDLLKTCKIISDIVISVRIY